MGRTWWLQYQRLGYSATTYRYLRDLICDQHSWSMYPPSTKHSPHTSNSFSPIYMQCSSMFNLQCSVFGPQVFLCQSVVCGHKCIHELEAYNVMCKAGDVISNSTQVTQFHSDSIPNPLPVRTLALQLLSTSSWAQPITSVIQIKCTTSR